MEIELKLSLDPAAAAALRRHPLLAYYRQNRPWSRRVENHYFDTPALDLQRRGIEVRLRREGSRILQTLKVLQFPGSVGRAAGGLHRLEEWEVPLATPALDVRTLIDWLPTSAAAAADHLQAAAAQAGFGVRVSTRFRRTTWPMMSVHGDLVELALDIGEIHAGGRTMPLCEVELELKGGEERVLFELAHGLHASLPLRPESRGKAERGFALLAQPPLEPPRTARAPRLTRGTPWAAALRTIVEECLAQMQANEAGVVGSPDAEYVHQMRVGLRRLRSALGLFKEFATPPEAVLEDLRWIAECLGRVRDAEVLAHETLPRVPAPAEPDLAWPALCEAAVAAADAARRAAVKAVSAPRHVGWQLALMAWMCGLPGQTVAGRSGGAADPDEDPLPAFAQRRLRRLRKRLARDGRRLEDTDASARHDARIVAKKLRYATEMLGALQTGHGRRPAPAERQRLCSLATLQQKLGLLNDAEVAGGLLAQMAAQAPRLAPAASYAQGWLVADAAQRVRGLGRVWRRVREDL